MIDQILEDGRGQENQGVTIPDGAGSYGVGPGKLTFGFFTCSIFHALSGRLPGLACDDHRPREPPRGIVRQQRAVELFERHDFNLLKARFLVGCG